jgi:hypothetical protein
MRNLRKLTLLAIAATAVMAFAASTASAAALEVRIEANNNHCPAVTITGTDVNGGCLIHATSESPGGAGAVELRKHVFGIESHITTCDNEFWGRVSENATGYIFEQQLTGPNCTRKACEEETESTPWAASGSENAANSEILTTNFCVENAGTPQNPSDSGDESCEIDVPFKNYAATDHHTEFGITGATEQPGHGISGFRCELVGHWQTEVGPDTHDGESPINVIVAHL